MRSRFWDLREDSHVESAWNRDSRPEKGKETSIPLFADFNEWNDWELRTFPWPYRQIKYKMLWLRHSLSKPWGLKSVPVLSLPLKPNSYPLYLLSLGKSKFFMLPCVINLTKDFVAPYRCNSRNVYAHVYMCPNIWNRITIIGSLFYCLPIILSKLKWEKTKEQPSGIT